MLALTLIVISAPTALHAQDTPGPPVSPPAADVAAAPDAEDQSLREEMRALREHMAAQQQELARQGAELEAMRAERAQPSADEAGLDAEVDALLASEQDARVDEIAEGDKLKLYGFMDVGLQKNWGGLMDTGIAPSTASTFLLGNVNLYIDAIPTPDWRALVEVRFTNLPQGGDYFDKETGQVSRVVSEAQDTSAVHGGLTGIGLNGLILERAHIDFTPSDLINVRAGVFLTPYGIWNVDHGAPVRIMARPPAFISADLVPERQTGVELFGTLHMLPWSLEYHLYASNGRQLGSADFDEDKAIGGRVVLGTRRPFGFRIGASFFTGSSEDVRTTPGVTREGTLGLLKVTEVAFDDVAGAGDIAIDIERLRIRSEIVVLQRLYEDGKRESYGGITRPDSVQTGTYLLVAYELPWYRLEPYVVVEYIRTPLPGIAHGFEVLGGGLNIYLTDATQLRLFATYSRGIVIDGPDPAGFDVKGLGARLVVAF